ncbi:MAG: AAA family ATPase [Verrucomicrobia bacterium]|nr:AAA family ATPase [Verrucomicrobiota bacterium]
MEFNDSLLFISEMNKKYLNKNTIILIDEYDAPITNAYSNYFYKEMTDFMRQLFSKALKGNMHLHKGFMTGVVRTARDGILSGLNNPAICTMLDKDFSDKFGFTQEEVEELLRQSDRLDRKEEVRSWYNGYVIGAEYLAAPKTAHFSASVYNPWSILNYLNGSIFPKTYWANTGNPELLERLIGESDETIKKDLELLLQGKPLQDKQINQDTILLDLDKKNQEPWSFLFFAGYLSAIKHHFLNNENYYILALPNEEMVRLYKKLVIGALSKSFSSDKLDLLLKALTVGDIEPVNKLLGEFVVGMCSCHDLPENDLERSYHLFVLGLLVSLSDRYVIKSNLESGYGRYDILMHPKNSRDFAVLLEFKKGKSSSGLNKLAEEAMKQMQEKKYISMLRDFGYEGKVFCYGVAVYKKELVAKMKVQC